MHSIARAVARFWRKAYEDGLTGLAAMVAYNLLLSIKKHTDVHVEEVLFPDVTVQ